MKVNKWTLGLAALGMVSLPVAVQAEEKAAMSPLNTALSSTTISGYVNTSAQWDLGSGNGNPPAFAYNAGKQDGFNLNVVKLSIERPLDEAQWSAGYKVDLLFGPDANGLATQSGGTVGGDFGIKQAYVTLRAPVKNGLDFKIGVFDTIIGYETFDAGSNPNYTRSYGYTLEPTTHTGVLATYQFSEMFSAAIGIANTFGPAINGRANPPRSESYKTYMASLAFTAPKDWGFIGGSSLYAGVINGFNPGAGAVANFNATHWYVGGTLNTWDAKLKLGAAFDYVGVHGGSSTFPGVPAGAVSGSSAYANAWALYASYQMTEKWSLHARGEYASRSFGTFPGVPSKAIALTGTLQYDLWKNVLSRLEFRWDHAADGADAYGGTPTVGGGATIPTKRNNYMLAANIIYKF